MVIASFALVKPIHWRLQANDPMVFRLAETDDWMLVNPLLYLQLPILRNRASGLDVIETDKFLCANAELVLVQSDQSKSIEIQSPTELVPKIEQLSVKLRHLSGQASFPCKVAMTETVEISELPNPVLSKASSPYLGHQIGSVSEYWWTTAITSQIIETAATLIGDFTPSTHEVLFLDAYAAFRTGEYRTAILYSAISVEVALGSVIDDAHQQMISTPNDERFRVTALPQAGGTQVIKDPVFDLLKERSDFLERLHELSLYALNRSLFVEDQTLHARVRRLNSTRNKLVHFVKLSVDPNSVYSLDREGATGALSTAISFFKWLGLRHNFPSPKDRMMKYPSEVNW
jgi:hypothetical protein